MKTMNNTKLPFGKYKGRKIFDIYIEDERYLRWFIGFCEQNNNRFIDELLSNIYSIIDPNYIKPTKVKKEIILRNDWTEDCPWNR